MNRPLLCLVEDDPIMGESLADRFGLEGFDTEWHKSGGSALEAIAGRPYAAVISDIRLPDLSGEELFTHIVQRQTWVPPFVFITAFGSVERAVALLKMGAADYITKPFDIGNLVEKVRTLTGVRIIEEPGTPTSVLGISAAARRLTEPLPRIAPRANTVLITGESGVGKEVLARHIHAVATGFRDQPAAPFVAVNCGAFPETLIEAEFFGYEKGAFTGAERQRRGFFEQADGGTLFLDEIGDLPLLMQVKLLRAIQERRTKRLGGEREVPSTFRLVCATNRDLTELVKGGLFREDLFYRINVVNLRIPPLRERPEDVLWLASRIVIEVSSRLKEPVKSLHPSTEARLVAHTWPGNVRELRNRLERACIVSERPVMMPADVFDEGLSETGRVGESDGQTLEAYLAACERLYLESALRRFGGRIADTAKGIGISRKNLWEKMRRHGLDSHGVTDKNFH